MMVFASPGLRSNQSAIHSLQAIWTKDLASVLPSLPLVWPSNWGSRNRIEMIAARPSRTSSPDSDGSFSLSNFFSLAYLLTTEVNDARKPSSWVPPSWVLMVLAKECTDSLYDEFHCIATSTSIVSPLTSKPMIDGWIGSLVWLRCLM